MERELPRRHLAVDPLDVAFVDEGSGSPVLLLHGFPDSADLWRYTVPALAVAGHRVIAPDLRGYGETSRPAEKDAYNLLTIAGDVIALLDDLGIERAAVVGHDWGAALAWAIAAFLPERCERLAAISVGHPAAFAAAGIEQQQLSFYMLLFQFEGIAEEWMSADGWANFRAWVTVRDHPARDFDRWVADLERPGALTAALNWYRANVPPEALTGSAPLFPPVTCPVLGVWGSRDFALGEAQMTGSAHHVTGPWRYEQFGGAGHWLPVDEPDRLNQLLVEFLAHR
jgi:pimeloyl-ACP methyl ester carboxylesterase